MARFRRHRRPSEPESVAVDFQGVGNSLRAAREALTTALEELEDAEVLLGLRPEPPSWKTK